MAMFSVAPKRLLFESVLTASMLTVAAISSGSQALASHGATAHIYNPMSFSNTIGSTYDGHPVRFFSGWANRFAIDINSPDEYANAPIWFWGDGNPVWSQGTVLTGSPGNNAPLGWPVWANDTGPCLYVGDEYAMALSPDLSNGLTAGFAVSHLSNYHYTAGSGVLRGAQIANLSWLSNGRNTYNASNCNPLTNLNSTAPHIHVESARTGTTTFNSWDPASGPSWRPYWYYNY